MSSEVKNYQQGVLTGYDLAVEHVLTLLDDLDPITGELLREKLGVQLPDDEQPIAQQHGRTVPPAYR